MDRDAAFARRAVTASLCQLQTTRRHLGSVPRAPAGRFRSLRRGIRTSAAYDFAAEKAAIEAARLRACADRLRDDETRSVARLYRTASRRNARPAIQRVGVSH